MQVKDMKQQTVTTHDFSMVPRADIPRASFPIRTGYKTAFSSSNLIPVLCEEVLPGDTWNVQSTIVARTATPIVPIQDNWFLETFFFFVPNRLVWTNWAKFMGEQDNPADSIAFTIPTITSPASGFTINSLADYFGIPPVGQIAGGSTIAVNALPFRAYNLIYNRWFRDENLINSRTVSLADGPDTTTTLTIAKRGKRHDVFTACLPWPQKGNTAVSIPLGTSATVKTQATEIFTGAQQGIQMRTTAGGGLSANFVLSTSGTAGGTAVGQNSLPSATGTFTAFYPTNLFADLTTATAATINQLRLSFQIQKLLERDARGGTRYKEIVLAHFGVVSPDARLDWPEYLGGGQIPVLMNAIPQTSATGLTGGTTPAGTLAATANAAGSNGFTYAATEHGYIIGLIAGRADLTYSQGLRKHWSKLTRYDYYFPAFAMLGETAVLNREIYCRGDANDALAFGYQERWYEHRYIPSQITGLYRPTSTGNIAFWHTSQQFSVLPTLNQTFIEDDSTTVMQRNFAGGAATANQQFLCDILFTGKVARPLPAYSIPGDIDRF